MSLEKCLLGIDLGGTKMLATLFDRDLKPIAARKERTPESGDGEKTVETMIALARSVLKEASVGQDAMQAAGIAVPGTVSPDRKRVRNLTNIGLSDYALAARFESEFGVPAWLENDVRAGVYAELKRGALKGYSNAVGVFIGTGIGGAIVLNGELWRGSSGMAGEIGHMVIQENGPRCGCGANGCLEALASRSAMAKEAVFAASSGKAKTVYESAGTDFRKYKASVFEEALEADEKEIVAIIDRAAARVGLACASVANLLNPQAFLLGGGLVNRIGEYYRKRVKESFDAAVMKDLRGSVKFLLSAHKDQAVSLGAGLIALESSNGGSPIA